MYYNSVGNEDKRVGHFSSDYVWMGNESPVKPEKNYSQDDLPEISKKIEKLVFLWLFSFVSCLSFVKIQEVKQDVLSDDLENNFMTSFALNTLNPKLEFIGKINKNSGFFLILFLLGDNPAITEKTIKNFKEKLQTKPEAFGNKNKIFKHYSYFFLKKRSLSNKWEKWNECWNAN